MDKANQKYFEAICAIPHPSGKEKAISDFVAETGKRFGYKVTQDALWNVVVRIPASPGCEQAPPVMLQAHLDMVCVKTPDSDHVFEKDPLKLYVDGQGHIRARETTLGADDGYGVAYLLAVIEEAETFKHPELELVFTSQEENGCWGAKALDMTGIRSRRMIGLDVMESTKENVCCVSCFCSDLLVLRKEMSQIRAAGEGLKIVVDGIQPIREGAQVHPELYNAIKLSARLLCAARDEGIRFHLVSMHGGEAENYNPVACETVLVTEDEEAFTAFVGRQLKLCAEEIEDGRQATKLTVEKCMTTGYFDEASGSSVLDALLLLPSNTVSIDQRTQEMTSTCCVGTVCLDKRGFEVTMSDRARSDSFRRSILEKVRTVARVTGCTLAAEERYAPWVYRADSFMLKKTADLMERYYGDKMIETVCPGGLEACDFLPKIPDLDIVMFAPIGEKCHSTEEYLDLSSFDRVYDFLKTLLSELSQDRDLK